MEDISSREAEVSSREEACSLAPSAICWLDWLTWLEAEDDLLAARSKGGDDLVQGRGNGPAQEDADGGAHGQGQQQADEDAGFGGRHRTS